MQENTWYRLGTGNSQSFNGAIGYLYIDVRYTQRDEINAKYFVECSLNLSVSSGFIGSYSGNTKTFNVSQLNGFENINAGTGNFTTQQIGFTSGWVDCDNDGNLIINANGSIYFSPWNKRLSVDGNKQFPNIPRNSKIENTQQTFNIEDGITLNIKKYNNAFTDNLIVKYGNTTLIERQNVNSTVNINFTTEQLDQIYSMMLTTNRGKFTFTLRSYKDNTPIGNANVFEIDGIITQANPIFFDFSYENIDSKTLNICNNSSYFVKDNNELKVNITTPAIGQKGATIVSYMVVCDKGNATIDSEQTIITGPNLKNLSTPIIKVYATDTRGNTTEVVKTITNWIEYTSPTKISYNYNRISGNEMETNFTFGGKWYPTLFNTTLNELRATYKYKETKNTQYTNGISNILLTTNGDNYEFNGLLNGDIDGGFSIDKSFNVVITISDLISSVDITYLVLNGSPAMDLFGNCVSLGGPYNEQLGGRVQINNSRFDGVVDNLNTSSAYKALSAYQGVVLYNKIKKIGDYTNVEKEIGVIDNGISKKTFYEKTIIINNVNLTRHDFNLSTFGINNVDFIWVDYSNSFIITPTQEFKPVSVYENNEAYNRINLTKTQLTIYTNTNWLNGKFIITLRYTKMH